MSFPKIIIDIEKIRSNAHYIAEYGKQFGVEIMGITKGVCAISSVVEAFRQGGVRKFGDSRLHNIKEMRNAGFQEPIYMIRLPMLSEAEEVVCWADGSMNSEVETIKKLSEKANLYNKQHKVILMVDFGDLREGILPDDILSTVGEIITLPNIEFEGLAINQGCIGGTIPNLESMQLLSVLGQDIEKLYGINVNVLSGGSTATLNLLDKNFSSLKINQLRVGEAILLGQDTTNARIISGTSRDTLTLQTEVIEVKKKSSCPRGQIGRDAFGNIPVFADRGIIRRAIVGIGLQDCRIDSLTPADDGINILGASSDHLVLDVTSSPEVKLGSIIEFRMTYSAMLGLMTSKYVSKECI